MGTMIHLAVGRLEVDWGKNSIFSDHGALFQPTDLKPVPSYYVNDNWPDGEPIVEMNEGFGKPLGQIVDRLELLGFTMRAVEQQYAELHRIHDLTEPPIPFDEFSTALAKVDVRTISGNYGEDYGPGEFVRQEILDRLALNSEAHHYRPGDLRPDHWEVSLLLENFDANAALRLLAQNPENLALDVSWDFTPLVESGWATRPEFQAGASPDQRFLVVTEGSSDAKIIQHALRLYRPHISDFFRFVDIEDGYPFTGTGNLYRFTQGLVSIGIQNNTIVLYDNDAEGMTQLTRTRDLCLPGNLRAICLPASTALSDVAAVGPEGVARADINGRAASIECYLDFNRRGLPEPRVRWTTYNSDSDQYHGVLEQKGRYMKEFLHLRGVDSAYDSRKIEAVLSALVAECVSIAEAKQMTNIAPRRSDT